VVPAIHNAANDLAVPYTPVCSATPLPVCLHPAYAGELTVLTTVIDNIAAPLAGAPGMPVRAEQLPGGENGGDGLRVLGNPPVLTIPHFIVHGTTIQPAAFAQNIQTIIALALVTPPGTLPDHTTSSQRALALYLLTQANDVPSSRYIPDDAVVAATAQRLAALSPTARTAWLGTHLDAVRHGDLTPTDIP
jgi:hypothetical protein